ncbi:RNA polymerase subunit sigma-70 [Actinomadura madurae]|uniref:sigma factor n=1 Tax=Actinomadura madurae TaxID=1993 RepID=UPI002026147E|nr:sigma factor [Actinomadura madurae]URN04012.1 RNA polymerase subunit sigma-70 [Actinomadura madurae]
MTEEEQLAAKFEGQRPYLHAIPFRVLGSHPDADDAVQEARLRLARTGGGEIEDLRGWLTTVTGRICLDMHRRRGARGEQPLEFDVGVLQRETIADSRLDPEAEAVLAESVGLALYVVMDALTPAERVSFVLQDVFEVPFDAIAATLGRSTAASKMLASRAPGGCGHARPRPIPMPLPMPRPGTSSMRSSRRQASAAGVGSARGLAAMYAAAVSGLDGHFALGFQGKSLRYSFLGARAFGHNGSAGSESFADPLSGIAFGYSRRRFSSTWSYPEHDRLAAAVHHAATAS